MLRWIAQPVQFKTVAPLFDTPSNVFVLKLLPGRGSRIRWCLKSYREAGGDFVLLGIGGEGGENRAQPTRIADLRHYFNSESIHQLHAGAGHDSESTGMRGTGRCIGAAG